MLNKSSRFTLGHLAMIPLALSVFNMNPLCAQTAQGGLDPRKETDEQLASWRLSIKPEKQEILVDQPLTLDLVLSYEGEGQFRGAFAGIGGARAALVVSLEGKERIIDYGYTRSDAIGDVLPPADASSYNRGFVFRQRLSPLYNFGTSTYLFHERGSYSIRLLIAVWQGEGPATYRSAWVESNTVEVTVSQPSEKEAGALQLWRGEEQARVFSETSLKGAEKFGEGLRKLRMLLKAYPKSSYARLAGEHLAKLGGSGPIRLFPDDERLSKVLEIKYRDYVTLSAVISALSKASGVPLGVSEDLSNSRVIIAHTSELRGHMKLLGAMFKADWSRAGGGYLLSSRKG